MTQMDEAVLDYLLRRYDIRSMLDVGCGPGGMVDAARQRAVLAIGIDGDPAVADARRFILCHDYTLGPLPWTATDLVWSVEFVEHVAADYVENFLATFRAGRVLLMSHALPGQEGYHHVNCQPETYWRARLGADGWTCDEEATAWVRANATNYYMCRTGMVWVRHAAEALPGIWQDTHRPHDLVAHDQDDIQTFQNTWELDWLYTLYCHHRPQVVCEIGTFWGGTLREWLRPSAWRATVVSIDLPQPGAYNPERWQAWAKHSGHRLICLAGDSASAAVLEQARECAPFDWLFIDGDHGYDSVRRDWENYRGMVRPGGIIAFHDINERPDYGVAALWREIQRQGYVTQEINAQAPGLCGIGVVYLPRHQRVTRLVRLDPSAQDAGVELGHAEDRRPGRGVVQERGYVMTERLHVITACTRPQNLPELARSLSNVREMFGLHWWIVLDMAPRPFPSELRNLISEWAEHLTVFFWDQPTPGAWGHPQRSAALNYIDEPHAWVWTLDDDNLCHPDFGAWLIEAIRKHPAARAIVFAQDRAHEGILHAGPGNLRTGGVDTAQYVVRRDLIGSERVQSIPGDDGGFIQRIYQRAPEQFVFIDGVVTWYNWLRR